MRLAAYAGTSVALAAGCLLKAFNERPNYYSATVYLSQSNACVLILTNLALVCLISVIYGLQRLLYGSLRTIEIEKLSEKAWYAVLDTLFAMPSLRDDIGGWLLIAFVLLLAGKVWAWIAEGRVDILEQQPPANPRLFHARLSASLFVSVAFDVFMCRHCFRTVVDDPRPGMMVIFAFEYAILTIFSLFTVGRYSLALYEAYIVSQQTRQKMAERKAEIKEERRRALREAGQDEAGAAEPTDDDVDENEIDVPGWEEKRRWLFGLELLTDGIKIITYSIFFTISLTFIGFPMHAIRDAYLTVAAFTKRVQDYANYRRATEDMNSRYPDATTEELSNENTCIVCREAMVPWDTTPPAGARPVNEGLRAKKLPCGHILHLRCLKAWLERQQTCPTCRRPVITRTGTTPGARPAAGGNLPGNAGNNAQAGAQNEGGQQARQGRRNRLRWLNMGPIRVGFYNGPARQIQQALRAQGNAGADNEQHHSHDNRTVTQLPVQEHIRMAELSLMHDMHNLEVDRAQLVTIRAMEAEMARLRTLRTSGATTASSTTATIPQPRQPHPAATTSAMPAHGTPQQPLNLPPSLQAAQPYQLAFEPGTGTVNLPAGMTLPEGWSLTPLQRVSRTFQPAPSGVAVAPGMPTGLPSTRNAQSADQTQQSSASAPSPHGDATGQSISESLDTASNRPSQPVVSAEPAQPSENNTLLSTPPTWTFQPAAASNDTPQQPDNAAPGSSSGTTLANGTAESGVRSIGRNVEIEDDPEDGNA